MAFMIGQACVQVVTPVRRSQRSSTAAPPSMGAMLRGAGFMYAPNQALAPRLTPAAGRAAGALGAAAAAADLCVSLSPHTVRPVHSMGACLHGWHAPTGSWVHDRGHEYDNMTYCIVY